jgi:hypothetical protein
LKLVLATIVSEYNLELNSGAFPEGNRPEIPARRGVTLAPKKGVQMVFKGKTKTDNKDNKQLLVL